MRVPWIITATLCGLLCSALWPSPVLAAKGTPDSAEFGYGARLDIDGQLVQEGIQAAADLQIDWLGIDFNWAAHWPDPNQAPDLTWLDQAMQSAAARQTAVLLSLTQAPAWAMTAGGPDADLTAWLIRDLAQRYPALQAVELFPAANTTRGWGAAPSPSAYLSLAKTVEDTLRQAGFSLDYPAGGLVPLSGDALPGDLPDTDFLQGLYQASDGTGLSLISIRLPNLSGDPLAAPSTTGPTTLRHYEMIRQVMLANNHSDGILWVTGLSTPVIGDPGLQDPGAQTRWLVQAYQLLRAQLFVGVVFYDTINPSSQSLSGGPLLSPDASPHPFYAILKKLIAQNNRNFDNTLLVETQVKNINKEHP